MLCKVIFIVALCPLAVEFARTQQCKLPDSSRSCQPTCEFLMPPCREFVDPQDLCQCQEGNILLSFENRTCVPLEQCSSKCSNPNFLWNDCGTMCPKTCQRPKPRACPKICVPGCFCRNGLILNEENMECVKPSSCPK